MVCDLQEEYDDFELDPKDVYDDDQDPWGLWDGFPEAAGQPHCAR